MHYMEIGGAERSLLGLLKCFDTSKYDVDLLLNQHTGEFMSLIPAKINLLKENKRLSTIERPIKDIIKEGHIDIAIARLAAKVAHLFYKQIHHQDCATDMSLFQYVAKYTTPLLPSLKKLGTYDVAISFLAPHNIVKDKVVAKQKWAWIHTDYSTISINRIMEEDVWTCFDKIISISQDTTTAFASIFPALKSKIVEIENILSPQLIKKQSLMFYPLEYNNNQINICSVGRFCHAKNYDNIPHVAHLLKKRGLKFHWFIIGFGDDSLIKQNISETETNDCISLLGKKENPYPYIANCDIYAQPSRYEGKSVTVREAQILCRPIVITNYPTSSSQINDSIDGLICNMDNESIADCIYRLSTNQALRETLSNNLKAADYGNEGEIEKIYSMI